MSKYLGLDWAGNGWFGITLRDDGDPKADLYPSILSVWKNHCDAERILIDIPVGLREDGKRTCDEEAFEKLKPNRQNSVFPTPVRDAVYAKTLTEAKAINERYRFSISNQAWSITPRIREVDELFDVFPEAIGTVRESHPEVCFAALNDWQPMEHGKKTEEGIEERQSLLYGDDSVLKTAYEDAVETLIEPPAYARRLSKNAKDDVLDALVLALTARYKELGTLPEKPRIDSSKDEPLPIEIVYPVRAGG